MPEVIAEDEAVRAFVADYEEIVTWFRQEDMSREEARELVIQLNDRASARGVIFVGDLSAFDLATPPEAALEAALAAFPSGFEAASSSDEYAEIPWPCPACGEMHLRSARIVDVEGHIHCPSPACGVVLEYDSATPSTLCLFCSRPFRPSEAIWTDRYDPARARPGDSVEMCCPHCLHLLGEPRKSTDVDLKCPRCFTAMDPGPRPTYPGIYSTLKCECGCAFKLVWSYLPPPPVELLPGIEAVSGEVVEDLGDFMDLGEVPELTGGDLLAAGLVYPSAEQVGGETVSEEELDEMVYPPVAVVGEGVLEYTGEDHRALAHQLWVSRGCPEGDILVERDGEIISSSELDWREASARLRLHPLAYWLGSVE